jgi:hypothetical protein
MREHSWRTCLVLFLASVWGTSGWSGCVDPNNPDESVKIGQKTTICLQIGNKNNWAGGVEYIRLSFQPKVDEYSRIHIPNCTY